MQVRVQLRPNLMETGQGNTLTRLMASMCNAFCPPHLKASKKGAAQQAKPALHTLVLGLRCRARCRARGVPPTPPQKNNK